jgi:Glycosyltransferase Family 4
LGGGLDEGGRWFNSELKDLMHNGSERVTMKFSTVMPNRGAVLLFAFYYPPDNTSGVQRAVRIAKYLPHHGHRCYVVCSSHKGCEPATGSALHVPNEITRTVQTLAREHRAARIQRAVLPYNEELPWVPHALAAAEHLISREHISGIISTSPPVATHLAAMFIKRRHGLRWLADFRDPILGNPGRARPWARPYDALLQRWIFQNADAVVAVTDAVADEWRRKYPRWAHKFHVIWNGYDPDEAFDPRPLPVRSYQLCSHVGVLYTLRHPTVLLSVLSGLVDQGRITPDRLKLQFLGPLQSESEFLTHAPVAALIKRGALIIRNELIPRAAAMNEIATSDYLLLIDIVNLSQAGYTVPAKLYDYILAGRPILALTQKGSPADRILERNGARYISIYHDDSAPEIAQKLLCFFALPTNPVPPSDWFLANFNGERQAAALITLLSPTS